MMITIQNEFLSADISEVGAELIALRHSGNDLLWCRDAAVWGQCAPNLFPICGRLRGNEYFDHGKRYELPIHGFVNSSHFTVKEKTENFVALTLSETPETLAVYPFAFTLTVLFSLNENSLTVRYTVENTDTKPLFFSLGGHYGFAIHDDLTAYSVKFDTPVTLKRELLDGAFISGQTVPVLQNSDRLPLSDDICKNDTYVFRDAPRSYTLCHGTKEMLRIDAPDTPHLLIWTLPGAGFVCLEPWNGLPDGAKSTELSEKPEIITLPPERQKIITHKITVLS